VPLAQQEKVELVVRLADTADDVAQAQRLRHRVFMQEGAAHATHATHDADRYDPVCDHLLVVNTAATPDRADIALRDGDLVGTYRLLRHANAQRVGGFYSAQEYDIAPLLARKPHLNFLELGRSCVRADARDLPTAERLWQGIWDFVRHQRIDVMMGCASFDGTDPDAHAEGLTYLAEACAAPPEWQVDALPGRFVNMQRLPAGTVDHRQALRGLPPLIKGYVRLGCHVGHGAVIDTAFNSTDVLIVLPVASINPRYFAHFGQPGAAPTS
jgi:L-ornithine Nalpha-acyltransferase